MKPGSRHGRCGSSYGVAWRWAVLHHLSDDEAEWPAVRPSWRGRTLPSRSSDQVAVVDDGQDFARPGDDLKRGPWLRPEAQRAGARQLSTTVR
jgi:hypothetical protein